MNRYFSSKIVWSVIVGLTVILSIVFGVFQIEDRYAHSEDLKTINNDIAITQQSFAEFAQKQQRLAEQQQKLIENLNERINQQIIKDQINSIQQRIWALEDYYRDKIMPIQITNEIQRMKQSIKQIQNN